MSKFLAGGGWGGGVEFPHPPKQGKPCPGRETLHMTKPSENCLKNVPKLGYLQALLVNTVSMLKIELKEKYSKI